MWPPAQAASAEYGAPVPRNVRVSSGPSAASHGAPDPATHRPACPTRVAHVRTSKAAASHQPAGTSTGASP